MEPCVDYAKVIDQYYPADRKVRGILLCHSKSVAELALAINAERGLGLEECVVRGAAMLHDIGIIACDAPGIDCYGDAPYLSHGAIGADMLRRAGVPELYARVAERHTGAGLTWDEIRAGGLALPLDRSYMPETPLERLICYADCFFSKGGDGRQKSMDRVEASMRKFGPGVYDRFIALRDEFGAPKGS